MKSVPKSTYGLPKFIRILVIIHLCFVFTFLAWEGIYAFSKESLSKKSKLELFQFAFAKEPHENNATYLNELPDSEKRLLDSKHQEILETKGNSFFQNVLSMVHAWSFEISPWFQTWILFSLLSCFFILFRIKGVQIAIWVLPITILGYAYFHHVVLEPVKPAMSSLVPSESELIGKYLDHPLRASITDQKNDLEFAWKHYLIDRWSHEVASIDPDVFYTQAERGYYMFIVANLKSSNTQTIDTFTSPLFLRAPFLLVCLYFIWNTFFALFVSYRLTRTAKSMG